MELTPRSLDQTIPSVIPSIPSPPLSDLIYQESIETKFNKENNISFVTRIVAIYQLSDELKKKIRKERSFFENND